MSPQSSSTLMTDLLTVLTKSVALFIYDRFAESHPNTSSVVMDQHLKNNLNAKKVKQEIPDVFEKREIFAEQMDVHSLMVLIEAGWSDVFKNYPDSMRDNARTLLNARNTWAHQKPFSLQEVQQVAESAMDLLRAIKTRSAKKTIRKIRHLLRHDHYQHIGPPEHYIPCDDLLDQVKRELWHSGSALIALHGMGGIGKSVLARALCDDKAVQERFPDGTLWMTVGGQVNVDALKPKLRAWIEALNGKPKNTDQSDLEAFKNELAQLLKDRACLLVLDDVWRKSDFELFRVGGVDCRTIITTRDAELARDIGAKTLPISMMEEASAIALLDAWSQGKLSNAPIELKQRIVKCLGGLPLAVKLAGAQLQSKPAQTWLENFEARKLKSNRPENTHDSLEQTFALSLDVLDALQRKLYAALSIFKGDAAIHEAVIVHFWGALGQLSPDDGQDLVTDLASRALCEVSGDVFPRSIRLHNLLRDLIKHDLGDPEPIHKALISAYRSTQKGVGWHTVPDDDYFYSHFAYHLQQAGALDTLRQVLLNYPFLQAKLDATNLIALIKDYQYLVDGSLQPLGQDQGGTIIQILLHDLVDDSPLQIVLKALVKSEQILSLFPEQLPVCLYTELMHHEHKAPEIADLIQTCYNTPVPHLFPTSHTIISTYGMLIHVRDDKTLEVWRWRTGRGPRDEDMNFFRQWITSPLLLKQLNESLHQARGAEQTQVETAHGGSFFQQPGNSAQVFGEHERPTHMGAVNSVALLGDFAVSASDDQTLKVWNWQTGEELRTLKGHTGAVNSVALSSGFAVSASDDQTLKVWNWQTGEELRTLKGHTGAVNSVALSSGFAVSASDDQTLKVWNWQTGEELRTLKGHTEAVCSVALSGDFAVSASDDQTLKMWNWQTGETLRTGKEHTEAVNSMILWNGVVVWASSKNILKERDWRTGEELPTSKWHFSAISSVALWREFAVTPAVDGMLNVWNWQTGETITTFHAKSQQTAVTIGTDALIVVSGGRNGSVHFLCPNPALMKVLQGSS